MTSTEIAIQVARLRASLSRAKTSDARLYIQRQIDGLEYAAILAR